MKNIKNKLNYIDKVCKNADDYSLSYFIKKYIIFIILLMIIPILLFIAIIAITNDKVDYINSLMSVMTYCGSTILAIIVYYDTWSKNIKQTPSFLNIEIFDNWTNSINKKLYIEEKNHSDCNLFSFESPKSSKSNYYFETNLELVNEDCKKVLKFNLVRAYVSNLNLYKINTKFEKQYIRLDQISSTITSRSPSNVSTDVYKFNIKIKSSNKQMKTVHYTFKVIDEQYNQYYLFYCETINKDYTHMFSHSIIKKDLYNKITKKVGIEFFETTFPTTRYKYNSTKDDDIDETEYGFPQKTNYHN